MNHLSDSQSSINSFQSSSTTGSDNSRSFVQKRDIQKTSKEILEFLASICKPQIKLNYYLVDLFNKYKLEELQLTNFLEKHTLTSKQRSVLLDNICIIICRYDINFSTYPICCGLIDTYLKKAINPIDHNLQNLLVLCCTMIGSKFNDVSFLRITNLIDIFEKYLKNHKFDEEKITIMEIHILNTIQYKINQPTAFTYLSLLLNFTPRNEILIKLSLYILKIVQYSYEIQKSFYQNEIAVATLYVVYEWFQGLRNEWDFVQKTFSLELKQECYISIKRWLKSQDCITPILRQAYKIENELFDQYNQ